MEDGANFLWEMHKTSGNGHKLQQKKVFIRAKQKFLHAAGGGQTWEQRSREAVKSPVLEIFRGQKEKELSCRSKLSLIFTGADQMMSKSPFQPKLVCISVVPGSCIYRSFVYLLSPARIFLSVTDFPSAVCLGWVSFFPRGLRCWVFLLKLPSASISQNKNLMPETFFKRHWLTEIIPYYRFPGRIIHGKCNVSPILPITYFFEIQITAVRTTNKLFSRMWEVQSFHIILSHSLRSEKGFASVKKALCYMTFPFVVSYLMFQWVNFASQIYTQV